MVTVTISKDKLKVQGHAPSDNPKPNENIICAAVSTLVQALEVGINKRFLEVVRKEPGDLEYKIYEPTDLGVAVCILANMKMVIDSVKILANENPEHIEVVEE